MADEGKKQWIVLGIGIVVYAGAVILSIKYKLRGGLEFALFAEAYLLIGFSVFRRVVANIEQRQYFNENGSRTVYRGGRSAADVCSGRYRGEPDGAALEEIYSGFYRYPSGDCY